MILSSFYSKVTDLPSLLASLAKPSYYYLRKQRSRTTRHTMDKAIATRMSSSSVSVPANYQNIIEAFPLSDGRVTHSCVSIAKLHILPVASYS